jgi:hypothetical protein
MFMKVKMKENSFIYQEKYLTKSCLLSDLNIFKNQWTIFNKIKTSKLQSNYHQV